MAVINMLPSSGTTPEIVFPFAHVSNSTAGKKMTYDTNRISFYVGDPGSKSSGAYGMELYALRDCKIKSLKDTTTNYAQIISGKYYRVVRNRVHEIINKDYMKVYESDVPFSTNVTGRQIYEALADCSGEIMRCSYTSVSG